MSYLLIRLWAARESNSHEGLPRHILSVVRLPISPAALGFVFLIIEATGAL